jgi:[ribosomal protein S18]-alanine N-acetyltransferase
MIDSDSIIQLRPMTAADVAAVLEIAESLPHAPRWSRAAYLTALDPDSPLRRIALVAESGLPERKIAGFVVAVLIPPAAELETIAVAMRTQRRGVARQLFTALSDELRASDMTEVTLEVRASNLPALGFYRALGFAHSGRRTRYYADPVEDAVLMRLNLSPAEP